MENKKRLIDANALLTTPWVLPNRMTRETALECFKNIVKEQPTIDAVEVVHGRWVGVDSTYWRWYHDEAKAIERTTYRCSECARKSIIKTNYCPNCGAKMDGDGNE